MIPLKKLRLAAEIAESAENKSEISAFSALSAVNFRFSVQSQIEKGESVFICVHLWLQSTLQAPPARGAG